MPPVCSALSFSAVLTVLLDRPDHQLGDGSMQTVRQIAQSIVEREGGYVDDPDDPGGVTKFGVTIHTMRKLGIDLNRDGAVTKADVKMLGEAQAVDIFVKHYFDNPRISLLPNALHATVFDMYVNAGRQAVVLLQTLLRQMGYDVAADGRIGPITAQAAQDAARPDATLLQDAYGIARRNYYFRLADRRGASRKFARSRSGAKGGWIRRAEEFISPEYHLSNAEFNERVSGWG